MTVLNIDCIEGMRMFPDNHFDSVVTDPPYELGFMGKSWDASGIAYSLEMWREVLRVLKPGGHMLAFSGSRTYHRMVCAIEDAGFEVRDQIMWIYGSGFPKSLDVSKAIDKTAGAEREVIGTVRAGIARSARKGGEFVGSETFEELKQSPVTAPATDAARQWQGWGTALKPAHEPICVARKPLIGTVAANVLAHGTGGLNIDGCRIPAEKTTGWGGGATGGGVTPVISGAAGEARPVEGRWPANLIHDGSDEVLAAFPNDASRFYYAAKASKSDRNEGLDDFTPATTSDGRAVAADNAYQRGATLRANIHPTVKPTDLMRYLCRLITPPGGTVLDPFAGSGSTGKAAVLEGFYFVGFELSAEYSEIAQARIDAARASRAA